MKNLRLLSVLFIAAIAASCSSIRVSSDYDDRADFTTYKTYGFFKDGIDKADISDLDKKRIMRAIDDEFTKKGYTKSDKPDLLVNFFTKSRKEVNIATTTMVGVGVTAGAGAAARGAGAGVATTPR